jgi:hypothetical protein
MKLWYKTTGDPLIFRQSKEIQRHLIDILAINGAFSSTDLYMDNDSFYIKTINNKILRQFLERYHFKPIIVVEPPDNLKVVYSSSLPVFKSEGD